MVLKGKEAEPGEDEHDLLPKQAEACAEHVMMPAPGSDDSPTRSAGEKASLPITGAAQEEVDLSSVITQVRLCATISLLQGGRFANPLAKVKKFHPTFTCPVLTMVTSAPSCAFPL